MLWLVTFTLFLLAAGIWIKERLYAPLKKVSHIPGPPQESILKGNFESLTGDQLLDSVDNWKKEYGTIYKFMFGRVPIVVITDLDAIYDILVAQQDMFVNRPAPLLSLRNDSGNLLFARDESWRQLRRAVSPAFNSLHLKETFSVVNSCADTLVDVIQESVAKNEKGTVDVHLAYQRAALDVIAQVAFRSSFDNQRLENDPLSTASRIVVENSEFASPVARYLSAMPELLPYVNALIRKNPPAKAKIAMGAFESLANTLRSAIERKDDKEVRKEGDIRDFIDMMQAAKDPITGTSLTSTQIESLSLLFLLAGHETTSNTLAFTSFLLSQHPDVEAKMMEEINRVLPDGRPPSSSADLKQLEYVGWVIDEALRLFCPAPILIRESDEDVNIKGVNIPARTNIWMPIWTVHRDPSIWGEDAGDFKPDRHANPPSHPVAFLAFGAGPRNCVGMRFAILEAKMLLVRMYQKFSFELPSSSSSSPSPSSSTFIRLRVRITVSPADGVVLRAIPRNINTNKNKIK